MLGFVLKSPKPWRDSVIFIRREGDIDCGRLGEGITGSMVFRNTLFISSY